MTVARPKGNGEVPGGILLFGGNGSGKSTVGREVARLLSLPYMDVEAYHFAPSEVPYTVVRPREECVGLLLADMERYRSFVFSAVMGDFGEAVVSKFGLAVLLSAPLELRLARVRQRSVAAFGPRALEGGDLWEQTNGFIEFVASRSLEPVEQWAKGLPCPLLRLDGSAPVFENAQFIAKKYQSLACGKK